MRIISCTATVYSALTLCNVCDAGLDVILLELTKQFPLVTSVYQLNVVIL